MEKLFLLIILTQNAAGDINASFVNTKTLKQCQQKASLVTGVFKASAIPVIESRCYESNLQFSEFGHAITSSQPRNFYLVYFEKDAVQISLMPDWFSCMQKQKGERNQRRVYCSSSIQSPVSP